MILPAGSVEQHGPHLPAGMGMTGIAGAAADVHAIEPAHRMF